MYLEKLLSELLNQPITHRTLGFGTIKKVHIETDGKIYIFVVFDRIPAKEYQFLFPGIFTDDDKRMQSDSPDVNDVIRKIMTSKTCEICSRTDVPLTTWQGRKLCSSCINQFEYCTHCRKRIHPKEAARIIDSEYEHIKYYVCKECESQRMLCPECGDWHYPAWRKRYYPWIPDENHICPSCAEDRISECQACERELWDDELIEIDGLYLCKDCSQTAVTQCVRCKKTILKQHQMCDNCEKEVAYEGFLNNIAATLENNPSKVIKKTFKEFRREPHTNLINRLSKRETPYAECLLIDIGSLNLVVVYLTENTVKKYYSHQRGYEIYYTFEESLSGSTMTKIRTDSTSNDWWNVIFKQKSRLLPSKQGNKFRIWERPVSIRGRTDDDRRWDRFVSGFYVIGTWRKYSPLDEYYCNNKSCPFTNCEKRLTNTTERAGKEILQTDMQCMCPKYTHYIADSLNKSINNKL